MILLCLECAVYSLNKIIVGMVMATRRNNKDGLEIELKGAANKYFNFLTKDKDIRNEKTLTFSCCKK